MFLINTSLNEYLVFQLCYNKMTILLALLLCTQLWFPIYKSKFSHPSQPDPWMFPLFIQKIKIFDWYFCFDSWCRATLKWMSSFASLSCHNRERKITWREFGTNLRCAPVRPHWNRPRPCRAWTSGLYSTVRAKRAGISSERFIKPARTVVAGRICIATSTCSSFRPFQFFLQTLRSERSTQCKIFAVWFSSMKPLVQRA